MESEFISPKDCVKYNTCKFADDSGCLDGCDFRLTKGMRMEYKVIENENIDFLVKDVNKAINDGWKPMCGISSMMDKYYKDETLMYCSVFYQAMIKN